jgi:hypothetical protein
MTEPTWAIVRSRTRCEDIVCQGFLNAGYRAYVPRFRVLTYPHGQHRKPAATMRALFAGLVFVQDWRGWPREPISQVIGRLPWNGGHASLSGADIAVLMDRERQGFYEPHAPRPPANGHVVPHVQVGDQVEYYLAGQLVEGVLRDLSESGRATIRVAMLGREVEMRVDAVDLRATG